METTHNGAIGLGRPKRNSDGNSRKKRDTTIILESEEEDIPEAEEITNDTGHQQIGIPEAEEMVVEKLPDEDVVWNAVEWDQLGAPPTNNVYTRERIEETLRTACLKAWEDGIITDDEINLLKILKEGLEIDDDTFDRTLDSTKPEEPEEALPPAENPPREMTIKTEFVEESAPETVQDESVELQDEIDYTPPPEPLMTKKETMITLTSGVRGSDRPLGRSFVLGSENGIEEIEKRCPSCNSIIRINLSEGKDRCPICGVRVPGIQNVSPLIRSVLDKAKVSYRSEDLHKAVELYDRVLKMDEGNKEALFYLQKIERSRLASGIDRADTLNSRDLEYLSTGVPRLDNLLPGGLIVGSQTIFKGPSFCGKDVLMDHVTAVALRSGFPVIYVSTNRSMNEVMKGIIKRVPDFKRFNRDGMVRMFDLFSKHSGEHVLKEGHRIFNIEAVEDFRRFRTDLLEVQEGLVDRHGGGLIVINSLSPLIIKVDHGDLMKFLQVLIARSKGYRFTGIMDLASGAHDEATTNSVEYLMDGIIEFREKDDKYSLRLKGFRQNVPTRDWIDYSVSREGFDLYGSFTKERIA